MSQLKVYLDDRRSAPEGWTLARTLAEAQTLFAENEVTHLSLDYHLGFADAGRTGLDFVEFMNLTGKWPTVMIQLHSNDPCGRRKMTEAIRRLSPIQYGL